MEQTFDITILSMSTLIIFGGYILGGIVDAVSGGGGLIMVPALMASGMPPHLVVGTNQLSLVAGCGTSLYRYAKTGNFDFRTARMALPFTLIGAVLGSRLNLFLSEHYLQLVMVVLLPVLAAISFLQRDFSDEDHSAEVSRRRMLFGSAAVGLLAGTYHAFYGPASGTFYMIGFAMVLRCGMLKANGNGRCQLLACNLLAGLIYAFSGYFCWKAIVICTCGYVIGNWIGAGLATRNGARFIKKVYYVVLTVLFIKLIADLVATL